MLMLLTNHTLTGVVLGLTIDNPAVLAPTAVASHLVLDSVPHFGIALKEPWYRDPKFIVLGSADFALSALVAGGACIVWPHRIFHILIGVIGAQLPDLTYIPLILFGKKNVSRALPFYPAMLRFLARIQWSETPTGFITEVIWACGMAIVLRSYA